MMTFFSHCAFVFFTQINSLVNNEEDEQTHLQEQLAHFGRFIGGLTLVVGVASFLLARFRFVFLIPPFYKLDPKIFALLNVFFILSYTLALFTKSDHCFDSLVYLCFCRCFLLSQ